jgi:hypothetical protein
MIIYSKHARHLFLVIIMFISYSIRLIQAYYRYYETESFHYFADLPRLLLLLT